MNCQCSQCHTVLSSEYQRKIGTEILDVMLIGNEMDEGHKNVIALVKIAIVGHIAAD